MVRIDYMNLMKKGFKTQPLLLTSFFFQGTFHIFCLGQTFEVLDEKIDIYDHCQAIKQNMEIIMINNNQFYDYF